MQLPIRSDLRVGQADGVERNRWPIGDMREPFFRRYFVVDRNAKGGAGQVKTSSTDNRRRVSPAAWAGVRAGNGAGSAGCD